MAAPTVGNWPLDAVFKDCFIAVQFQKSGLADWPAWRTAYGWFGSLGISDEWLLSGDEYEEKTVV
ncbi:MAG: hypothetical protein Q7U98_01100 [Methylicorpusculum sp.]|uniref:hypothetical protein n=1 Tax=Methylicorpusculum sp. TaxID=2713644 RepID=UPI00271D2B22|nr:hypothetical protein [Methylicorpusculum sp.]MDO8937737.1 hypothetical protein [Methylicorpusculum sp.]